MVLNLRTSRCKFPPQITSRCEICRSSFTKVNFKKEVHPPSTAIIATFTVYNGSKGEAFPFLFLEKKIFVSKSKAN